MKPSADNKKTQELDERVLAFLNWSVNFTVLGLAKKIKVPVPEVHASIMRLVAAGLAYKVPGSRYDSYHAVVEPQPEPESTKYVAPFREYKEYDPGQLMRLCEGSRNPKTGMT